MSHPTRGPARAGIGGKANGRGGRARGAVWTMVGTEAET